MRPSSGSKTTVPFAVLMLDVSHRVLAAHIASIGARDHSVVEPREVFRAAVLAGAKAVILGHNHPSGDPTPSDADCQITGRLRQAGQLLGIRVLDHVIIAREGTSSLRALGLYVPPGVRSIVNAE